jgi:peroxiredoxin family protein
VAAYIIANWAAAYNHKVTIFHTFRGLNALRKDNPPAVKKSFLERQFAKIMPRGADKTGLSNMNMVSMGQKMIKQMIHKHNAMAMPQLIEMAQEQEINLAACTMAMNLLRLKQKLAM